MLTPYILSFIRTSAPVAVGALLTWLAATLGVVVGDGTQAPLVALCVAVLSAAYYAIARLLEKKFPWASVLLGTPPVSVNYKKKSA